MSAAFAVRVFVCGTLGDFARRSSTSIVKGYATRGPHSTYTVMHSSGIRSRGFSAAAVNGSRVEAEVARPACVVVVTSGKGGVGKTTTAASLSYGLAQAGHRTCVIDFDIGLRNLDLHLGCERRVIFDFVNVIQEMNALRIDAKKRWGQQVRGNFNARKVNVGDTFQSRQELTSVARIHVADQGRGWEVERGGRRQAPIRCAGHTRDPATKEHRRCRFRVAACKQIRVGVDEWKVTNVIDEHVDCSMKGPPWGLGVSEPRASGDPIVSCNLKKAKMALRDTLKVTASVTVNARTARRLKRVNLEASARERAEGFQYLGSYLEELEKNSGGIVADA